VAVSDLAAQKAQVHVNSKLLRQQLSTSSILTPLCEDKFRDRYLQAYLPVKIRFPALQNKNPRYTYN
jgi:hypothetical protein